MSKTITAPALLAACLATSPASAQMHTPDGQDTDCLSEAFDSIELPDKRISIDKDNRFVAESRLNEDFRASIQAGNIYRRSSKGAKAPTYHTMTFKAQIDYLGDVDKHRTPYRFEQTISVNHWEGNLYSFSERAHEHGWMNEHVFYPPEIPEDTIKQSEDWVRDASRTLALIFGMCRLGVIYEPPDNAHLSPPSLPVLKPEMDT